MYFFINNVKFKRKKTFIIKINIGHFLFAVILLCRFRNDFEYIEIFYLEIVFAKVVRRSLGSESSGVYIRYLRGLKGPFVTFNTVHWISTLVCPLFSNESQEYTEALLDYQCIHKTKMCEIYDG